MLCAGRYGNNGFSPSVDVDIVVHMSVATANIAAISSAGCRGVDACNRVVVYEDVVRRRLGAEFIGTDVV